LPGVVLTVTRRAVVSMTTTCEAIVLVFELRLCSLGSRRTMKVWCGGGCV
jgi:hypothetical protein